MLNKKILFDSGGPADLASVDQQITVTGLPVRPAANAGNYQQEQMKSRRLRRQTRLARERNGRVGGWSIGLW